MARLQRSWCGAGEFTLRFRQLATGLLVVIAVHFMALLDRTADVWAGLIGAAVSILGTIMLAADRGRVVPNHDSVVD